MPALLTVVTEGDIRRGAKGDLTDEDSGAVLEVIRTDTRAQRIHRMSQRGHLPEKNNTPTCGPSESQKQA